MVEVFAQEEVRKIGRKIIYWLVKKFANNKMFEWMWQAIQGFVEVSAKVEANQGRRKIVNWLIKMMCKSEVS